MDLKANLTKAQTTVKTSDMKLKHNAEALKKAKAEMKKVSFYNFHNMYYLSWPDPTNNSEN